jgi:serine/threonine protein kinase
VPCFVDFFTDVDKQTYLITEAFIDENTHLPAKDLKYVLKHNTESTFPLRDRLNVYLLILKTVKYFNEIGIKHKDLKPENILVNSNFDKIQIIDFGVACYKRDKSCFLGFTTRYQPAGYQQPKHTTYNQISDLYSLIVILGDLLYAKKYDITLLEIEHISLLQFAQKMTQTPADLTSLLTFYKLLLSNCDGSQFCNNTITHKQLISIFEKACNSFA